jgi:hypothetical protein
MRTASGARPALSGKRAKGMFRFQDSQLVKNLAPNARNEGETGPELAPRIELRPVVVSDDERLKRIAGRIPTHDELLTSSAQFRMSGGITVSKTRREQSSDELLSAWVRHVHSNGRLHRERSLKSIHRRKRQLCYGTVSRLQSWRDIPHVHRG